MYEPQMHSDKYMFLKHLPPSQCTSIAKQSCEAMKRLRSSSGKSKVKGGTRQRLRRRLRDEAAQVQTSSVLATLLLSLFAWGEMSPQLLQRIAHAAYRDACSLKENTSNLLDLEKMAGIGCEGLYSNKCFGDLMKVLPFRLNVPAAMTTRLPFKAPLQSLTQGILMPHELFSFIFHHYPATWTRSVFYRAQSVSEVSGERTNITLLCRCRK